MGMLRDMELEVPQHGLRKGTLSHTAGALQSCASTAMGALRRSASHQAIGDCGAVASKVPSCRDPSSQAHFGRLTLWTVLGGEQSIP